MLTEYNFNLFHTIKRILKSNFLHIPISQFFPMCSSIPPFHQLSLFAAILGLSTSSIALYKIVLLSLRNMRERCMICCKLFICLHCVDTERLISNLSILSFDFRAILCSSTCYSPLHYIQAAKG